MSLNCTRCEGTGFLNHEFIEDLVPSSIAECKDFHDQGLWLIENYQDHDVSVCDCCGNGENWHDVPGEHYNADNKGKNGPYAYNGGLCECH